MLSRLHSYSDIARFTTERYLESTLDYQNAVNDGMGLEVE